MCKILTLVLILTSVGVVAALQDSGSSTRHHKSIEAAVLAANDRINETGTDVDKFFLEILPFDNGMLIQDGTILETRQKAYENVKMGFDGVSQINRKYDKTYVTVLSSEHALLSGSGSTKILLYDGRTIETPFAVSMIFVHRDGQWKVLQGHYSTPNPR